MSFQHAPPRERDLKGYVIKITNKHVEVDGAGGVGTFLFNKCSSDYWPSIGDLIRVQGVEDPKTQALILRNAKVTVIKLRADFKPIKAGGFHLENGKIVKNSSAPTKPPKSRQHFQHSRPVVKPPPPLTQFERDRDTPRSTTHCSHFPACITATTTARNSRTTRSSAST